MKRNRKLRTIVPLFGAALLLISIASCTNLLDGSGDMDRNDGSEGGSIEYDGSRITVKLAAAAEAKLIASSVGGTLLRELTFGRNRYATIVLPRSVEGDSAIETLSRTPGVRHAEGDIIYHVFAVTPNDPLYAGNQWGLQVAEMETAWGSATGSGVVVAVLDTGVMASHEDFGGTTKFVEGIDIPNEATSIPAGSSTDDGGHGTHVAGIIAAVGNNNTGVAGVAWDAQIMPVDVFSGSGAADSDVAAGIVEAVDDGADVINMSLGGPGLNTIVADAVDYALSQGVAVIAAAGNDSRNTVNYPAAIPGVIAVASSNGRDDVSDFSTGGPYVSVSAPGSDILSLGIGSDSEYVTMDGTSMAAPFVAGLAALLKEANPTWTPGQIKNALETSAQDIGSAGVDPRSGSGRVDAAAALSVTSPSQLSSITVTLDNNGLELLDQEVLLLDSSNNIVRTTLTGGGIQTGQNSGEAYFNNLDGDVTYTVFARYGNSDYVEAITATAPYDVSLSHTFSVTPVEYTFGIMAIAGGGGGPDGDYYLVDESLNQLGSAFGIPEPAKTTTANLLPGDPYFLILEEWLDNEGFYSVIAQQGSSITAEQAPTVPAQEAGEPDNAPISARNLPRDTHVTGYLGYNSSSNDDVDWYRFVPPTP